MKSIFFILTFLFILSSCIRKEENLFLGDWYELDEYIFVQEGDSSVENITRPPRPPEYYPRGFSFKSNDSVRFYLGIWLKTEDGEKYFGEFRKYKISSDSIKFYNPNELIPYREFKYEFLHHDTLLLSRKDKSYTYVRFTTKINRYQILDSIRIIETSGWNKHREYFIDKTGKIQYVDYSSYYSGQNKINKTGAIPVTVFKSIETRYNWSDFMSLGDYSNCCDGTIIETIFYYDGEVVKRIIDYENSTPMRYIWSTIHFKNTIESNFCQ
jgi:hypothetical protein